MKVFLIGFLLFALLQIISVKCVAIKTASGEFINPAGLATAMTPNYFITNEFNLYKLTTEDVSGEKIGKYENVSGLNDLFQFYANERPVYERNSIFDGDQKLIAARMGVYTIEPGGGAKIKYRTDFVQSYDIQGYSEHIFVLGSFKEISDYDVKLTEYINRIADKTTIATEENIKNPLSRVFLFHSLCYEHATRENWRDGISTLVDRHFKIPDLKKSAEHGVYLFEPISHLNPLPLKTKDETNSLIVCLQLYLDSQKSDPVKGTYMATFQTCLAALDKDEIEKRKTLKDYEAILVSGQTHKPNIFFHPDNELLFVTFYDYVENITEFHLARSCTWTGEYLVSRALRYMENDNIINGSKVYVFPTRYDKYQYKTVPGNMAFAAVILPGETKPKYVIGDMYGRGDKCENAVLALKYKIPVISDIDFFNYFVIYTQISIGSEVTPLILTWKRLSECLVSREAANTDFITSMLCYEFYMISFKNNTEEKISFALTNFLYIYDLQTNGVFLTVTGLVFNIDFDKVALTTKIFDMRKSIIPQIIQNEKDKSCWANKEEIIAAPLIFETAAPAVGGTPGFAKSTLYSAIRYPNPNGECSMGVPEKIVLSGYKLGESDPTLMLIPQDKIQKFSFLENKDKILLGNLEKVPITSARPMFNLRETKEKYDDIVINNLKSLLKEDSTEAYDTIVFEVDNPSYREGKVSALVFSRLEGANDVLVGPSVTLFDSDILHEAMCSVKDDGCDIIYKVQIEKCNQDLKEETKKSDGLKQDLETCKNSIVVCTENAGAIEACQNELKSTNEIINVLEKKNEECLKLQASCDKCYSEKSECQKNSEVIYGELNKCQTENLNYDEVINNLKTEKTKCETLSIIISSDLQNKQKELDECLINSNECDRKYNTCISNSKSCDSKVASCTNNLTTCNSNYSRCTTEKSTVSKSLATCEDKFLQNNIKLEGCQKDFENINILVASCADDINELKQEIEMCTASLAEKSEKIVYLELEVNDKEHVNSIVIDKTRNYIYIIIFLAIVAIGALIAMGIVLGISNKKFKNIRTELDLTRLELSHSRNDSGFAGSYGSSQRVNSAGDIKHNVNTNGKYTEDFWLNSSSVSNRKSGTLTPGSLVLSPKITSNTISISHPDIKKDDCNIKINRPCAEPKLNPITPVAASANLSLSEKIVNSSSLNESIPQNETITPATNMKSNLQNDSLTSSKINVSINSSKVMMPGVVLPSIIDKPPRGNKSNNKLPPIMPGTSKYINNKPHPFSRVSKMMMGDYTADNSKIPSFHSDDENSIAR